MFTRWARITASCGVIGLIDHQSESLPILAINLSGDCKDGKTSFSQLYYVRTTWAANG